ncbi:Anaphase spindle elongation protein 1 [Metarhizium anisopliae]|nr:Anaphase spindle elongation protein 1 [Metarhizium anisopliae]
MDTSYLAQQVNSSIAQLHGLFDEIGVPNHEREARESELFTALSEALNSQVRLVTTEKKDMIDEAKKIITTIRQMETSLDDSKPRRGEYQEDEEFKITYPLNRCVQGLREKHIQISRLHKERFEQVKTLVEALESYSSHLEPTFVQIALPPTGPNQSLPPTFDISNTYVEKLDAEFTRVYDEYMRRIASVQALSNQIIQLWAELGVPQAQQDGAIVKYYRDAPEQLGLHQEDLSRLHTKRDRLSDEKKNRERRLKDLKSAVEALWLKLGIDEGETKTFLNKNRGCGVRQINEFEDELARLNELKRQNLHLFVEDSRVKLQELWDSLYFSEDEMLEFTPAFSDVYSDALLEAHEREVARLEALREQRAPILAVVDKHKSLIKDRDDLAASSQDASRLMMRGQKGEKRDPGKLLREEKMRKRIAKELPKVSAEVRKMLERWEDEYGRPFLVFGERYLDELEPEETKRAGPASRSKTPAKAPPSTVKKSAGLTRVPSTKTVPPRSMTKTPTAAGRTATKKMQSPGKTNAISGRQSPSRIPARVPLSNLKTGGNSPERPSRPESRAETLRNGAPVRAPPPKMRDLKSVPELQTPKNPYKGTGIVRQVEPEDVYDDGAQPSRGNWETYDDNSEPEEDVSEDYYNKLRAARGKRYEPEQGHGPTSSQAKRLRGIPGTPYAAAPVMIDHDGNRIISGSEWTDEDVF